MKRISSFLLALMLVFSLTIPAFAATYDPGTVNYAGESKITIKPDMTTYTSTDLFGGFKGVMPGDTRVESVTIKNWALQYDFVYVYMEAKRHPEKEHVTDEYENLADMHDFLSKLDMQINCGTDVIFHDSPDQEGDLSKPVFLGSLGRGKSLDLEIILNVPIELDNTYANRVGEVDWVFYFEGFVYETENPKTGDEILLPVAAMIFSTAALAVLFTFKRRRSA